MSSALATWCARHLHALLSSLGRLTREPFATILTVLVMALALALPLGLDVLVRNARSATGDFSDAVGLSAYLRRDVAADKARQLADSARQRPGVAQVTLVTAAEGLRQFREQSGFAAAIDALGDNPLPHLLAVRPSPDHASTAAVEELRRYLASWPEVEMVQVDSDWVRRFNAILGTLRRTLLVTIVLLGGGVIAVVGNTIRLEILNRRPEIEVTRLVGGSRGFVRRPFLYTGALYGLLAGLLGWIIVALAMRALLAPAVELARAYGSPFLLSGPSLRELGWMLLAGVGLGWIGAWIAAGRQLSRIEPTG
jgi:cell division transport system permease protein